MKATPSKLITSFVQEKFDGDITSLATFPLGSLRNNEAYGCPGRNFDSDDTELMRAIYCVVFGETWKNLSIDNVGSGKLRGDTLNTSLKVLMKQEDCDPDLEELVRLNDEDFEPFYGKDGWRRFIDGNMLEYYVDDGYHPVISSKGYTFWRGGYTNRERFIAECHRYIDFSTMVINDRAKRMIEIIKKKCKGKGFNNIVN